MAATLEEIWGCPQGNNEFLMCIERDRGKERGRPCCYAWLLILEIPLQKSMWRVVRHESFVGGKLELHFAVLFSPLPLCFQP